MPNHQLNYNQQHQEQDNWCWAAVSTSIDLFYSPGNGTTQCALANQIHNQTDCCTNGSSPGCDRTAITGNVLSSLGRLRSQVQRALSFVEVDDELNAAQPVAARIGWSSGGFHVVVISGNGDTADEMLTVRDPWNGDWQGSLASFRAAYLGTGTWVRSYLTQP